MLPFGGRNVVVDRPRVRSKGKGSEEVELPSVAAARQADPMPAHVAEQVVVGVSTQGYERSLEPVDESVETRGESKSNVSRALVENTTDKLADFPAGTGPIPAVVARTVPRPGPAPGISPR